VHTCTGLDDTAIADSQRLLTTTDFSTIYSDSGGTLYLQSGERSLPLRRPPLLPKQSSIDMPIALKYNMLFSAIGTVASVSQNSQR